MTMLIYMFIWINNANIYVHLDKYVIRDASLNKAECHRYSLSCLSVVGDSAGEPKTAESTTNIFKT